MARTSKKSASAAAPTELLICTCKTDKAATEVNALAVAPVSVAEIVASDSVKAQLCLNIMAGKVDPAIIEAHGKRGGLKRLFPGMANAEANALRICLDAKPDALAKAWQGYTATHKRIRNITLQALAKSVRPASEGSDKVTLRDALAEWCADKKNQAIMDAKGFPASLYDIFADYELIAEEGEDE